MAFMAYYIRRSLLIHFSKLKRGPNCFYSSSLVTLLHCFSPVMIHFLLYTAWQSGSAKHGQRRAEHQRFTILHHYCPHAALRWEACRLWTSVERDGGRKNAGGDWHQRWCPRKGNFYLSLPVCVQINSNLKPCWKYWLILFEGVGSFDIFFHASALSR